MWIGAGLAQQDEREFGRGAERLVCGVHHGADILWRHAAFDTRRGMAVGGDGDVRGLLQEREFGGDLTMRQARTTAAPLMICTSGITRMSPSIAK
jgi:hypothetical protein